MTKKEQNRIILWTLLISSVLGALILSVLFLAGEIDRQASLGTMFVITFIAVAITIVIQRIVYGWVSRRFLLGLLCV